MMDARDSLIHAFQRAGFKCDRRLCRRTINGVTQLALIDRVAAFIEESFFSRFSTPEQIEEYARNPSIPEISCSVSLQNYVNGTSERD